MFTYEGIGLGMTFFKHLFLTIMKPSGETLIAIKSIILQVGSISRIEQTIYLKCKMV
jgi:hypothetical protein